jgi:hypothetical protein
MKMEEYGGAVADTSTFRFPVVTLLANVSHVMQFSQGY